MRCRSFCTAAFYQVNLLGGLFPVSHYATQRFGNVLHVRQLGKSCDLFFFKHGCFVTWGLDRERERILLEQLKSFSVDPLETIETDSFIYYIGKTTKLFSHQRFSADIITIAEEEADNVQIKLAISYGLAQSVQLEAYEESVEKTIADNSRIPRELSQHGRIALSRRAIAKRIGSLFLVRSSVNLSSEYLDVPEYFWRYSNLESYYILTEKFLDIPKRVAALNHKLDVIHGIFEVLSSQLQHRYSSMLEFVIILLIGIEILVNLIQHI